MGEAESTHSKGAESSPYAAPKARLLKPLEGSASAEVRQPHLERELAAKVVGALFLVFGCFGLAIGGALVFSLTKSASLDTPSTLQLLALLVGSSAYVLSGLGLFFRLRLAWAPSVLLSLTRDAARAPA